MVVVIAGNVCVYFLWKMKPVRDIANNIKHFDYRKEIENYMHVFHGPIRASFSTEFLRENKDWLR